MMIFFLLPKDLVLDIINDWLGSLKDFSSLDRAVANKELRSCLLFPTASQVELGEAIDINSDNKLMGIIIWKEKRLLKIKNIWLNKYKLRFNSLPYFGCFLPHLEELKIEDQEFQLQDIFYSSLSHLEKLSLIGCMIVIQELALDCIFLTTNVALKQLDFEKVRLSYGKSSSVTVSSSAYTKFYIWVGKCCSKVEKLRLHQCHNIAPNDIIPCIQTLPCLHTFEYCVPDLTTTLTNNNSLASLPDQRAVSASLPHIKKLYLGSTLTNTPNYRIFDHLLNVLFQCCIIADDKAILEDINLFIDDFSEECRNHLLQHISHHWHNVINLEFRWKTISITRYLIAFLESSSLLLLQALSFYGTSWEDEIMLSIIQAEHQHRLPHLHNLTFAEVSISTSTITCLCGCYPLAHRLTVLSLCKITSLPMEGYHLISLSFPHLQTLELVPITPITPLPIEANSFDARTLAHHLAVIQWLDVLFSDQCAFRHTIETMKLEIMKSDMCLELTKPHHQTFASTLLYDHLLPLWAFHFPQLQCLSFIWKANCNNINLLIRRIVINCPHLHTLSLQDVCSEEGLSIDYKNQRELIRKLRDLL